MLFDLVLVSLDGLFVVAEQGVSIDDAMLLAKRWNALVEGSAILFWPSSIPLPEAFSPFLEPSLV